MPETEPEVDAAITPPHLVLLNDAVRAHYLHHPDERVGHMRLMAGRTPEGQPWSVVMVVVPDSPARAYSRHGEGILEIEREDVEDDA